MSNYAKPLQNMPGLSETPKNSNKLYKCCIKPKRIALKYANDFQKLCTVHKTEGTG